MIVFSLERRALLPLAFVVAGYFIRLAKPAWYFGFVHLFAGAWYFAAIVGSTAAQRGKNFTSSIHTSNGESAASTMKSTRNMRRASKASGRPYPA